jgi:Fic family protein
MHLRKDIPSCSIQPLRDIPRDDWYRLFVDARFVEREKGWEKFAEREKNCLPGYCKGAEVAFSNLENKTLTVDLIKELHKQVSTGVELNSKHFTPGEYRKNNTGFFITRSEDDRLKDGSPYYIPSAECIKDMMDLIGKQINNKYDDPRFLAALKNHHAISAKGDASDDETKNAEKLSKYSLEDLKGSVGAAFGLFDGVAMRVPVPFGVTKFYEEMVFNTNTMADTVRDKASAILHEHPGKYQQLINDKGNINFEAFGHELREELIKSEQLEFLSKEEKKGPLRWRYRPIAPTMVAYEMDELVHSYNTKINLARNQEEKLFIIAETIWHLDHIHPFRDGNTRVSILLLNRLLLQNGFNVATFWDPNVVDLRGIREFANEIKIAIQNTEIIQRQRTGNLLGFNTDSIPENKKQEMRAWTRKLYLSAQMPTSLSEDPVAILPRLKNIIENEDWTLCCKGDGVELPNHPAKRIPNYMYAQWLEIKAAEEQKKDAKQAFDRIIELGVRATAPVPQRGLFAAIPQDQTLQYYCGFFENLAQQRNVLTDRMQLSA